MLRRQRRRVIPEHSDGWETADDKQLIVRRPLRDATPFDRFLIAVFFFMLGAIAVGGIYYYVSQPKSSTRMRRSIIDVEITTPLTTKTGADARNHFLLVCLAGGVAGALGYVALSIFDPYGTAAAARAEEKRRQDRAEKIRQLAASGLELPQRNKPVKLQAAADEDPPPSGNNPSA